MPEPLAPSRVQALLARCRRAHAAHTINILTHPCFPHRAAAAVAGAVLWHQGAPAAPAAPRHPRPLPRDNPSLETNLHNNAGQDMLGLLAGGIRYFDLRPAYFVPNMFADCRFGVHHGCAPRRARARTPLSMTPRRSPLLLLLRRQSRRGVTGDVFGTPPSAACAHLPHIDALATETQNHTCQPPPFMLHHRGHPAKQTWQMIWGNSLWKW